MDDNFIHLRAVGFDWAGTVFDFGCQTPALVIEEIFGAKRTDHDETGKSVDGHQAELAAEEEDWNAVVQRSHCDAAHQRSDLLEATINPSGSQNTSIAARPTLQCAALGDENA